MQLCIGIIEIAENYACTVINSYYYALCVLYDYAFQYFCAGQLAAKFVCAAISTSMLQHVKIYKNVLLV